MAAPALQRVPPARRRGLLVEPTFGWGKHAPRNPTSREVWTEWVDAHNFVKHPTRRLPAIFMAFHLTTFGIFAYFIASNFSALNVAIVFIISNVINTIFGTVWYHRYCTHRAYTFRNMLWPRLFLWLNPVCFREESYVIPHHVHHARSDKPGDPYGPHLGWLGSYLATPNLNTEINRSDYGRLARSLRHIGLPTNTFDEFRKTGSIETTAHWAARSIFATGLWCSIAYMIAGNTGVLAWMSSVFLYTFLVRDFNYRGHGGPFLKATEGHALNQASFGFLGGEWHANHHARPGLANTGFSWWQIDVAYAVIRLMHFCGIVVHINTKANTARG